MASTFSKRSLHAMQHSFDVLERDKPNYIARIALQLSKGAIGKELRLLAGMTQDEVGEELMRSQVEVSHWESGRRTPNVKVAGDYIRLLVSSCVKRGTAKQIDRQIVELFASER